MITRQQINDEGDLVALTGAIVSSPFLQMVEQRHLFQPEKIASPVSRKVMTWCWEYFQQYRMAPGNHIEDLFRLHIRTGNIPEEHITAVANLLSRVSERYAEGNAFNAQYAVSVLSRDLEKATLQALSDDIQGALLKGKVDDAHSAVQEFHKSANKLSSISFINPYLDEQNAYEAFQDSTEPRFTLPGALGEMLNEHLTESGLILLQAPEKRGKTWLCVELAQWSIWAGNPTLVFSIGDQNIRQMTRRMHVNLSGRNYLPKYCGEMWQPCLDCEKSQGGTCDCRRTFGLGYDTQQMGLNPDMAPDYVPCDEAKYCPHAVLTMWWEKIPACQPLSWGEGLEMAESFRDVVGGLDVVLSCHPTKSITVKDMHMASKAYASQTGKLPRVIIVDYPDVCDKEPGAPADIRHQYNETWMALRRWSLDMNVLLIAPTQSDIEGHLVRSQSVKNFSENKTKFAHITGAFALNQTPEERVRKVLRLGQLLVREGELETSKEAVVLQNLARGRAHLGSFWMKKEL